MMYHVFPGNNEHLVIPMVRFLRDCTDSPGHARFLVFRADSANREKYESGATEADGIVFVDDTRGLDLLVRTLGDRDYLVFHSLLHGALWNFLFHRPWLWRRVVWLPWGGDFHYDAFLHPRGLRQRWRHCKVALMARRFRAICTLVPRDYDLIAGSLGCAGNYFRVTCSDHSLAHYQIPSQWFEVASAQRPLRIQVGNSAARTNEHLAILDVLASYRQENLEVWCPLSYGDSDIAYRDRVRQRGHELFGDRFKPLLELMPLDRYMAFLDQVDILVFNHRRQQGLFNVSYMLFHGKKVFLRSDTTTYAMLQGFGINIWDTDTIRTMDFREFATMEVCARRCNIELAQEHLSRECARAQWQQLFALLAS
jgi:dTDP-N-acetylfucosamine:lipid II N-acetylfucosaminyltransferase